MGPGTYEPSLVDLEKSPVLSMGAKLKDPVTTNMVTPSCDKYNIPSKMIETPGKSLTAKRPAIDMMANIGKGPAQFNVSSPKKNNFAYSMAGKLDDFEIKKTNFIPGPGNYDPKSLETSIENRFRKGRRSDLDSLARNIPGPGEYKMPQVLGRINSKGSYSFGGAPRSLDNSCKELVPGPGKYPVKPFLGTGHATSMRGKGVYDMAAGSKDKPGPGEYTVSNKPILERAAAFSMGKEPRKDAALEKLNKF